MQYNKVLLIVAMKTRKEKCDDYKNAREVNCIHCNATTYCHIFQDLII